MIAANYYGLNTAIVDFAGDKGILPEIKDLVRLSTEYLVLTVFFVLIISLNYGISHVKDFSISTFFLGTIGMIYTINNLYPYGRFAPFQAIVPTTTNLAANVLNMIGYNTTISPFGNSHYGQLTSLTALMPGNPPKQITFQIAWPCAGVESLIIYAVTILLFLKKSKISWTHRSVYFFVGAAVTYFINILRIVSIFVIGINGGDWLRFHDYYGQLYSITWIMSYPLIIIGIQILWNRIKSKRFSDNLMKKPPASLSPSPR